MPRDMSHDEWRAFVQEGTRTGKLATTRADRSPHVAPIWFVLDGDDFVFTTGAETVKGKAIGRDPRVAFVVDDEQPPFAFVAVRGIARASADLADLLTWATRISARYMGEGRAEEFAKRNAVEGELLVRVTPTHVVAVADMTGSD